MAHQNNKSGLTEQFDNERVQTLQKYHIWDTDMQNELEGLVSLASDICNAPISLVNLINSNTQLTKARIGWDLEKIMRESSFCQYTIQNNDLMIVENAEADDRFKNSPFVTGDPNIRFYAGMPLKSSNGHNLGALCVIDNKPRELTDQQKESLRILAEEVVARFELKRNQQELERQNEKLKKAAIFIKNSSDIQAVIDPETLEILEVNSKALKLLECERSDIVGSEFGNRITDEEIRKSVRKFLKQTRKTHHAFLGPVRTKTGNTIYLNHVFTYQNGLWYMTARDVTRRQEARMELEKEKLFSEVIINNLPGVFCLADKKGYLKRWNNHFAQLVGLPEHELRDSRLLRYFDTNKSGQLKATMKEVFKKGYSETEGYLITKSGERIPHILTGFSFTLKNQIYFAGVGVDISKRKETEQNLQKALKILSRSQQIANVGSWEIDLQNNKQRWSDEAYRILGYEIEEYNASQEKIMQAIHPDDIDLVKEDMKALKNGKPIASEHRIISQNDGAVKHVIERAEPEFDNAGNVIKISGIVQDITDRKQKEKELKKEKKLSDKIINSLPVDFFMFDENNNAIRWNENVKKNTGYNEQEIAYLGPVNYFPNEEHQKIKEKIGDVFKQGQASVESTLVTKSGIEKPYPFNAARFKINNKSYLIGTGQNISEQKQVQQQLQQSLHEKEILLAEVHHRVKNNLAIISGLLQLESSQTEQPAVRAKLQSSQLRIHSMATVHELLYQGGEFANLPFKEFTEKIVASIKNTYQQRDKKITVQNEADKVTLNVNQAIPCALIINELVTNAFEHAFTKQKQGAIQLSLNEDNDTICLKVADNGKGLPDSFSLDHPLSLGYTLIKTLAKQLDADINVDDANGTQIMLTFEKKDKKGSSSAITAP